MRAGPRVAWLAVLAGLLLTFAGPADAHALLRASEPTGGSRLDTAPGAVSITFTEEPEPSLSAVRVLDASGGSWEAGRPASLPGDPRTLGVPMRSAPDGVYTVTWRVLSRVDGHVTAGAFAFGVGVTPAEAVVPPALAVPVTPPPSALEMAGRWALFAGLVALLGAAWVGAALFRGSSRGVARLAGSALAVSAAGLVLFGEAQRRAAGVGIGDLASTAVGRALAWRGAAILASGVALAVVVRTGRRARAAAMWAAGLAAAGAMLAHVSAGHAAAAESLRWARVGAQWAHVAGAGVWIGGLAALLVGIRGAPSAAKARAVRQFSTVAGLALAVVAVTGVLRAVNEIGSWGGLVSSGYGRIVAGKSALLLLLAGLGAINRYRNVPAAERGLPGLRRVSGWELAVAAVTLGAAAVLASLAPPAGSRAAVPEPDALVVTGSDFATSVRVRMEVRPGYAGVNRFVLRISDYDTGDPVDAGRVALRFAFLDSPDVGESELELEPSAGPAHRAEGGNLSLDGRW